MTQRCRDCHGPISAENRTGFCRRCAPARRYDDPEYRMRHAAAAAEAARRTKPWLKGNAAMPKGSEPRMRAGRHSSQTKLAHVPSEYRDLYRAIRDKPGTTAKEALQIVLDHAERERQRIRRELQAA